MDRRPEILRQFKTLLRRWRGYGARLIELTMSHQTLRVNVTAGDGKSYLRIACIEPLHIQSPIQWENSDIEIVLHADGFLLRDENAGVLIIMGSVEISEYGDPPNDIRRQ